MAPASFNALTRSTTRKLRFESPRCRSVAVDVSGYALICAYAPTSDAVTRELSRSIQQQECIHGWLSLSRGGVRGSRRGHQRLVGGRVGGARPQGWFGG